MVWVDTTISSLPASWQDLRERLPQIGDSAYIFFIADNDSKTGQPWCPDVRAALPVVKKVVDDTDKEILVVRVGSKKQWISPSNEWRKKWELPGIPTLAKYTNTQDGVTRSEVAEEDFAAEEKVRNFLG